MAPVKAARVTVPESQPDAMVMVEDPEDVVIVREIQNAELARQLATFMNQLQGESAYTGISVFVIFALGGNYDCTCGVGYAV